MLQMMREPWFYVALMTALVVLAVVPLMLVRLLARHEQNDLGRGPRDHVTGTRRRPRDQR